MDIEAIKKTIILEAEKAAQRLFGEKPKGLVLGFPPDVKWGDFSIGVFSLAKQFKKDPQTIASLMAKEISLGNMIEKVEAMGPYLNFKIKNGFLFKNVCSQILKEGLKFGNAPKGPKKERVMVEYLSPNTNKPLHLGHLRNGALGMAISNLLETLKKSVIKANLINDRGVHICKSIIAWQKWAKDETPRGAGMKGDHFVGKWYVRFAKEAEKNPTLKKEVEALLRKWEAGDKGTLKIWRMMNKWVNEGFEETYKNFGLKFDVFYYESNTYKLGKNIVSEGLNKKVFYKNSGGSVLFDLPQEFGRDESGQAKKITLLRADNTSLYITQDLGTAVERFKKHKLNFLIYVAGLEQAYHFRCLFKILEALGYPWTKGLCHLSYGMVYLPEGKMKSREGKVVDADDLILEMEELAKKEITARHQSENLSPKEIQKRAKKIGVGAIKFYLLRVKPSQDIHFDPKESISFDGFTGPYCQYGYARAAGILSKSKMKPGKIDFSLLGGKEELALLQKFIQFSQEIRLAAEESNPSRIAAFLYETARIFNQFYAVCPVVAAENELPRPKGRGIPSGKFFGRFSSPQQAAGYSRRPNKELAKARLALVEAFSIVLKRGLNLLGIETLERM